MEIELAMSNGTRIHVAADTEDMTLTATVPDGDAALEKTVVQLLRIAERDAGPAHGRWPLSVLSVFIRDNDLTWISEPPVLEDETDDDDRVY